MDHQFGWSVLRRSTMLTVCAATVVCALPAASGAATVAPVSLTACSGTVNPDRSGKAAGEPNRLDYSFHCDGGITAYSIIVDQQGDAGGTIDDFAAAPSVLETDDLTPSPTEAVTCEGLIPSDGINCNTGALGAQVSDGFYVAGTVDPVAAYCAHYPSGSNHGYAPAGTPTVPTAKVQLVVSDYTGAEDGPFTLRRTRACRKVAATVPYSTVFAAPRKHARSRAARH